MPLWDILGQPCLGPKIHQHDLPLMMSSLVAWLRECLQWLIFYSSLPTLIIRLIMVFSA